MLNVPDRDTLLEACAALQLRMGSVTDAAYGTVLEDGTAGEVSHTLRDTPTRDGVSIDGLRCMEDAAVVWIYEPDELLRQKAYRVPRTRNW